MREGKKLVALKFEQKRFSQQWEVVKLPIEEGSKETFLCVCWKADDGEWMVGFPVEEKYLTMLNDLFAEACNRCGVEAKSCRNDRARRNGYCSQCDYELAIKNEYYANEENPISDADFMW